MSDFRKLLIVALASLALLGSVTPARADISKSLSPSECLLHPSKLDETATKLVRKYYDQAQSFPNIVQVRSSINLHVSSSQANRTRFVYEAFIRPLDNEFFAIPLVPLIGVHMERNTDAAYVCATGDGDPEHQKLVIYFMHGNGLEPSTLVSIFGDMFKAKGLHVAPLGASFVGLSQLPQLLQSIPILNIITAVPSNALAGISRLLEQTLSEFAGAGIERITVTPTEIELASGVDLEHPEDARILSRIPIARPSQAEPTAD